MSFLWSSLELVVGGLAGGLLGAALGGILSLSLAGVVIVFGEITRIAEAELLASTPLASPLEAFGLTGSLGLGPVLGPHVAFAGGVAAAAYTGRKQTFDTNFRYHQAKQIATPLFEIRAALVVGAVFGVLGAVVASVSGRGLPVDPIALAVVLSAFGHRIAFGYPVVGRWDDDVLDMSPHERGDRWGQQDGEQNAEGLVGRSVVEPWLPDYYEWPRVLLLGAGVGLLSGIIALATDSVFLAFGLSLASLAGLAAGIYNLPVTHHMALPASITALAIPVAEPALAVAVAAVCGILGGVAGELAQRGLYARADTHLDPAFCSIVVTSFLITVFATAGVLDPGPVPYPVL
jgi:hypothetical protein